MGGTEPKMIGLAKASSNLPDRQTDRQTDKQVSHDSALVVG
jgi:hypothetical protein